MQTAVNLCRLLMAEKWEIHEVLLQLKPDTDGNF